MKASRGGVALKVRAMAIFTNLGKALALLRGLRGKSQAQVAAAAGIGKSQVSKYENGVELPKLDSLEKVLRALEVGHFELFYTLHLIDGSAARPGPGEASPTPPALVAQATDQAFSQLFADLLRLYRSLGDPALGRRDE